MGRRSVPAMLDCHILSFHQSSKTGTQDDTVTVGHKHTGREWLSSSMATWWHCIENDSQKMFALTLPHAEKL
eukprot:8141555-Karenia_brevis.AAC.1